jgi:translation initiation factor 2 subunit 2
MVDWDYKKLLTRAKEKLPKISESRMRFQLPQLDIFFEGKTTVFKNFADVAATIRREQQHLFAYLLKELGTAGTIDGKRAIFKGRVPEDKVKHRVDDYISTFVLCEECKRPDTKFVREERVLMLACEACGARRPVLGGKVAKTEEIRVGTRFEVTIEDISPRGDGIAKKAHYIIYVPGTTKGQRVKVEVIKIVGYSCVARAIS